MEGVGRAFVRPAGSAAGTLLRHSRWDAVLVALSLAHGALLLTAPPAVIIALGLWWNANTISHNFIHLPFFRSPALNRAYGLYLSLLLGFPQSLWARRHLLHHGGTHGNELVALSHFRRGRAIAIFLQASAVLALWTAIVWFAPSYFLTAYLPGYAAGLILCQLQGYFEHWRGTTSHYGALYNAVFFNDGYHVEHHRRPSTHWSRLRTLTVPDAALSRWPPVVRWLDCASLASLERLVLASATLQRFVLGRHDRAFRALLPRAGEFSRVQIVGGGLFPRTALLLRPLLPDTPIAVLDASAAHLDIARPFLGDGVEFRQEIYRPSEHDCDALVVVPLAFVGDRDAIYRRPTARAVLVHDWIWRRRGDSVVISWLLLKRLNLVKR